MASAPAASPTLASLRGHGSLLRPSTQREPAVAADGAWQRATKQMEQRIVGLELAATEDKTGMDQLLQMMEDTMPMEEALADRSFAQQLAARLQRLEEGAAPAEEALRVVEAQVDRLARGLAEQEHSHAAALAELRDEQHGITRSTDTHRELVDAASRRKDLEEHVSARLAKQVEQLRVAAEDAGTRCTDLSGSVAACGRRLDSVESRVERQLAAATREVHGLSSRLQAELTAAASQRLQAEQSESVLAAVTASIGQFEMGQAAAAHIEPEPEPEQPGAAVLGVVASLEIEVAAQSKRLDTLSLELDTRGLEVALSSRSIGQSARSLAARATESNGSEAVEAVDEATPMLRRSLRSLETRMGELEARTAGGMDGTATTDMLPALVEDLVSQELAKGSLVAISEQVEEVRMSAGHGMSRLESNLSALVERAASQAELQMGEMTRRVGAVEDQSQRLAVAVDAANGNRPTSRTELAATAPSVALRVGGDGGASHGELQRLQREMQGQIEAAAVESARATEQLVQVHKAVAELRVAAVEGGDRGMGVAEEVERALAARGAAGQQRLADIKRDLELSIRSLELRCERCEGSAAGITALSRDVDELRICVTVEQQVRQQSAAVSAAVAAAAAAAIPGTPRALQPFEPTVAAVVPPPSPVVPLPVRAMSHQEIRQQLRKYKEGQEEGEATSITLSPAARARSISAARTPEPEPEPEQRSGPF